MDSQRSASARTELELQTAAARKPLAASSPSTILSKRADRSTTAAVSRVEPAFTALLVDKTTTVSKSIAVKVGATTKPKSIRAYDTIIPATIPTPKPSPAVAVAPLPSLAKVELPSAPSAKPIPVPSKQIPKIDRVAPTRVAESLKLVPKTDEAHPVVRSTYEGKHEASITAKKTAQVSTTDRPGYIAIDGERAGTSDVPGYIMVDAPKPTIKGDRAGYVSLAGPSALKVVDRPDYEVVGGPKYMDVKPPSSSKGKRKKHKNRSRSHGGHKKHQMEGRKKSKLHSWLHDSSIRIGKRKFIFCVCVIVFVFLLLLALLAVGAYFLIRGNQTAKGTTKPPGPPAIAGSIANASYFQEAVCRTKVVSPSSGPHPDCVYSRILADNELASCSFGICYTVQYHLSKDASYFQPYHQPDQFVRMSTKQPVFCRTSDLPNAEMRVCVNEKCDHLYSGTGYRYRLQDLKGHWRDNCDKPNPCWRRMSGSVTKAIFDGPKVITRRVCGNRAEAKAKCPSDNVTAAVVWMEHMYCDMNPSRTGDHCTGVPLRLWECAACEANANRYALALAYHKEACSPGENQTMHSNNCTIQCGKRFISMPDGSACARYQSDVQNNIFSYCFQGGCFVVDDKYRNSPSLVKNITQCEKDREERKVYWDRFKP